jgi:uncharacterized membrane protein
MEERNKTHKKKTIAEKKEIIKKRSERKIPLHAPLMFVAGVFLATLGGPWFAVAAAFIIGIGGGFVLCDWWTGRRRK